MVASNSEVELCEFNNVQCIASWHLHSKMLGCAKSRLRRERKRCEFRDVAFFVRRGLLFGVRFENLVIVYVMCIYIYIYNFVNIYVHVTTHINM